MELAEKQQFNDFFLYPVKAYAKQYVNYLKFTEDSKIDVQIAASLAKSYWEGRILHESTTTK